MGFWISSQLTNKAPARHKWQPSGVFIVKFEQMSHIPLLFSLFILCEFRACCSVFRAEPVLYHCSLSIPPEKIRRPEVYVFRRYKMRPVTWNRLISSCKRLLCNMRYLIWLLDGRTSQKFLADGTIFNKKILFN